MKILMPQTPESLIRTIARFGIDAGGNPRLADFASAHLDSPYRLPGEVIRAFNEVCAEDQGGTHTGKIRHAAMLALIDWLLGATGMAGERDTRSIRVAMTASILDPALHDRLRARFDELLAGTTRNQWCVLGLVTT